MPSVRGRGAQQHKAQVASEKLQQAERLSHFSDAAPQADEVRESIKCLYQLASTTLVNPQTDNTGEGASYKYFAKRLETDTSRNITSEQIWGQMTVLLAPIMTRVRQQLDRPPSSVVGNNNSGKSATSAAAKGVRAKANGSRMAEDATAQPSDNDSALEEELDGEIAAMLAAKQKKKTAASSRGKESSGTDKDDWRYAFGKGEESDDEEDDDGGLNDEEGDDLDNDSESVDMMGDLASDDETKQKKSQMRSVKDRNARAMADAELEDDDDEADFDEDGEEGEEEEEDPEDDRAALKELYGEDFSDDDAQLGEFGEEDEENDEEEEGEEEEQEEKNAVFNEEDGKYWGDDDILDDPEGQFGGTSSSSTSFGPRATANGGNVEVGNAEEDDDNEDPTITQFEREKRKNERAVKAMEDQRLYAGSWAMTGEVSGTKRPHDSLLEESLEFEHAMRPVPVITEAVTAKLEDRIRKRIVDKNFDDVKKRATRTSADDLVSTRRDAVLESEKSKMSLMDLYEKDFLEKQRRAEEASGTAEAATAEPLTEIEKDELRAVQMWRRLAQHLDALSNFHFTPKPVKQDLEARVRAVENQAPAIAMESIGNLAVSRDAALAPQDLYRPAANTKFRGVSVEEMDPSEKRALRRAKKESFHSTKERKEKQVGMKNKEREVAKKAAADAAEAKAAASGRRGKK